MIIAHMNMIENTLFKQTKTKGIGRKPDDILIVTQFPVLYFKGKN